MRFHLLASLCLLIGPLAADEFVFADGDELERIEGRLIGQSDETLRIETKVGIVISRPRSALRGRGPDLETRLAALDPERPGDYLELARDLGRGHGTYLREIEALDDLAVRLVAIAVELDRSLHDEGREILADGLREPSQALASAEALLLASPERPGARERVDDLRRRVATGLSEIDAVFRPILRTLGGRGPGSFSEALADELRRHAGDKNGLRERAAVDPALEAFVEAALEAACFRCQLRGRRTCPTCQGKGEVVLRCRTCRQRRGRILWECPDCDGRGTEPDPDRRNRTRPCRTCRGNPVEWRNCPDCTPFEGLGRIETACATCLRRKEVACEVCGGDGWREVPSPDWPGVSALRKRYFGSARPAGGLEPIEWLGTRRRLVVDPPIDGRTVFADGRWMTPAEKAERDR